MKIKFTNRIELEITGFNTQSRTAIYKAGEIINVENVEVNEQFETATIIINDDAVIYSVPLNAFEVKKIDFL